MSTTLGEGMPNIIQPRASDVPEMHPNLEALWIDAMFGDSST